jgi:competence protein ComEA
MPEEAEDNLPKVPRPAEEKSVAWFPLLLGHTEQILVAGVCLLAMVLASGYYWQLQARQGKWIEIDRVAPGHAAFQVDLNRAEWAELSQLPGIGESIARRIVESRATQGPFTSREDLRRVKGIGPRTMERLRPYLLPLAEPGTVAGGKSEARMTNDEAL